MRAQLRDELPRLAGGVRADGLPGACEGVEERDVAAEVVLRVREEVGAVGQGAEEVERRERVRGEQRGAERGGDEGRGEAEEEGPAEGAEVGGEGGRRGAEDEGDHAGQPRRRRGRGRRPGGVRARVREVRVRIDPLRRRERLVVVGSSRRTPAARDMAEAAHRARASAMR